MIELSSNDTRWFLTICAHSRAFQGPTWREFYTHFCCQCSLWTDNNIISKVNRSIGVGMPEMEVWDGTLTFNLFLWVSTRHCDIFLQEKEGPYGVHRFRSRVTTRVVPSIINSFSTPSRVYKSYYGFECFDISFKIFFILRMYKL